MGHCIHIHTTEDTFSFVSVEFAILFISYLIENYKCVFFFGVFGISIRCSVLLLLLMV